ncbi:hypothetical protein DPMN_110757 [Dreissena polymorpha]|uniref:HAT C-terminal dimerisation domain-containing protein n=1 Tax=Dreissena polymorpha TaxID=45954 RepID=A0A9D4KD64_DREPO|nr:hypothetical protein DPMN_110757 [Dreissena polymorpha]
MGVRRNDPRGSRFFPFPVGGVDNFEKKARSWCIMKYIWKAVREAMIILLTLPATTCTVERPFFALRRVKTWLRSTMSDDRLSGLCLIAVHRDRINTDKKMFIQTIIEKFGRDPRRLHFLFRD